MFYADSIHLEFAFYLLNEIDRWTLHALNKDTYSSSENAHFKVFKIKNIFQVN